MSRQFEIAHVPLPGAETSRKTALQALALDVQAMLGTWFPPAEGYRTHQHLFHFNSTAVTGRRLQGYNLRVERGLFWEYQVSLMERDEAGHSAAITLADWSGTGLTGLLGLMGFLAASVPIASVAYLAWQQRVGWPFFGYATAFFLLVFWPAVFGVLVLMTRPLARWASGRRRQRRTNALLPPLLKLLVADTLQKKGLL